SSRRASRGSTTAGSARWRTGSATASSRASSCSGARRAIGRSSWRPSRRTWRDAITPGTSSSTSPPWSAAEAAAGRTSPRPAAKTRAGSTRRSRRRTSCSARDADALAETAAAPTELHFANAAHFRELLGQHDEHIRIVERETGVRVDVGEGTLAFHGDPLETELAQRVLGQLYTLL